MKKILILGLILSVYSLGCDEPRVVSDTGLSKAKATIKAGADGLSAEQRNVKRRIELENEPGAIKHLYVISSMSGQVLIYSTVKGKITSSGKRLTPTKINGYYSGGSFFNGMPVAIGNQEYRTDEVLQDDGTYGSSAEYIFWFDANEKYHQLYVTGGQIVHISDQPMATKSIVLNFETNENNPVSPEEKVDEQVIKPKKN